ncbi:MaoC/PaaZ C-terminal domain-containing protein [Frondihabitans sp. PAMC 28766]|uniref:MaoC family dehydratase n=1 Tax=Frondihabitans sp. PAMC 28766 TaxID=1795630 RepID=UPI00194F939B|nr:MaoC/PaaZ C-terminal domain-containing protein [Frondihabitans sp. PAMC 28766]
MTLTDIVRFAGASGDFNSLHHDAAVARESGFPDVIAMGQLQAALAAGLLSDWVGVEHVAEFSVRFRSPVGVGDVIRLEAEVTRIEGAEAVVDVTASVDGRAVATASARVRTA